MPTGGNIRRAIGAALAIVGLVSITQAQSVHFAVIGDYGVDNANELAVANRVKLSNPDFIVTAGDNNYFLGGSLADWDRTQGKYYGQYIKYPAGSSSIYASNGVTQNNFYPALGNHDWDAGIDSYTDYFELPGDERYYSFTRGPVEVFVLDSDPREPDGRSAGSAQYEWAHSGIQSSTAQWQIVVFHHPAWTYVTNHGPETAMRWPFKDWGVDAVIAGHNHNLQRMDVNGLENFVVGSSGNTLYSITGPPQGAVGQFYNTTDFGFLTVDATPTSMTMTFLSAGGVVLDMSVIPEPAGFFGAILLARTLWRRSRNSLYR
jgi:hypothetical protein